MGHNCCSKLKVKRGLWSPEEDEKLIRYITTYGHGCWSSVPKLAGLQRCGKSCRLRWINYLRPDLKRGSFSAQEERIIINVHRILGNRWAQIAKHLPGRTDNEVKNFWNSCIKKKLIAQGLDPKTYNLLPSCHQPTSVISMNSHSPTFYESMTIPTCQNPQLLWNVKDQNLHASSIDFSPSSISASGSGFLDENCLWGGVKSLDEHPRKEEMESQKMEVCEVDEVDEGNEVKGGQDMETSLNGFSSFDLEFLDSTMMACGMYCNVSSMDQFAWDC